MSNIHITDHALLRWMERVHGVNVEEWRRIMRSELAASLSAYDGQSRPGSPAFIVSPANRVVTVIAAHQRQTDVGCAVPRVA